MFTEWIGCSLEYVFDPIWNEPDGMRANWSRARPQPSCGVPVQVRPLPPAVTVMVAGLPLTGTPPIVTPMVAVVAADGAVYVAVHAPDMHVKLPRVPVLAVARNMLGVAVVRTWPALVLTVTVTVSIPLTATELVDAARVVWEALALEVPAVTVRVAVALIPLA